MSVSLEFEVVRSREMHSVDLKALFSGMTDKGFAGFCSLSLIHVEACVELWIYGLECSAMHDVTCDHDVSETV